MRRLLLMALLVLVAASSAPAQSPIAEGYIDKGLEAYRQQNWKEAVGFFQQAVSKDPQNPHYYSLLGSALFASKQYYPAVFTLKKGLELDPKSFQIMNNLGTVYQAMGLFQQAEEIYLQAIEVNPSYPAAHRNLGVLYAYGMDRKKEAVAHWKLYLQLAPEAPDALDVGEEIDRLIGGQPGTAK